jgi:hypothetical protein
MSISPKIADAIAGQGGICDQRLAASDLSDDLRGEKRRTLTACIRYYENNRQHMRYDEYLAAGYPVGSGVAEVSHGKMHDVTVLDQMPIEPGSFYVMDRGYVDFARLYRFTTCAAFFVTRSKRTLDYTRHARRPIDKTTGLRSDQTIVLAGPKSSRLYPEVLRRIAFYDEKHQRRLVFLTNNFALPALTIAQLYKCRWQVELFFKWIKQHLRIKAFYGTNDNAVKTHVWAAISVYVLVAIVKKELPVDRSLYEILQILSVTLFEKTPINQALRDQKLPNSETTSPNQPTLFDL